MKKNYLILIVLLVSATFANAQAFPRKQTKRFADRVATRANATDQTVQGGDVKSSIVTKPFETTLPDYAIYFYNEDSEPIQSEKYVFSYDENKNIVSEEYSWDWENSTWRTVPDYKDVIGFDSEGREILYVSYYSPAGDGIFIKSYAYETVYHKGELPSYMIEYDYDENGNVRYTDKDEFEYDENDYLKGRKSYLIEGDEKILYQELTITSTKIGDKIESIVNSIDEDGDEWTEKWIFEYNDKYYITYYEEHEWDGEEFIPYYKDIYEYNSAGKLIREENYDYDEDKQKWELDWREVYEYDDKNNLQAHITYSSALIRTSSTIYYYDGSSSISNNTTSSISASLENGSLRVISENSEMISLISLSGVEVARFSKEAGELTVEGLNLPKGLFIIKGSSGWAEKVMNK